MEYISYGLGQFDVYKFNKIKNIEYLNKPKGGLWASPIDAKHGWKDWCEAEDFRDCKEDNSFRFTLKDNAKVYYINSIIDCKNMPQLQYDLGFKENMIYPDFEKMKQIGIDAIQFNLSNDTKSSFCDGLYWALYGWDCDCILVLNKDVIELLDK